MASEKKKSAGKQTSWGPVDFTSLKVISRLLGTPMSLPLISTRLESLLAHLTLLRLFMGLPDSKDLSIEDIQAGVRKLKAAAALNDAVEALLSRPGFPNATVQLTLAKNGTQYKATLVAKERPKDQVFQPFTDVVIQRELKTVDLDSRIEPSLLGAVKRLKGGE